LWSCLLGIKKKSKHYYTPNSVKIEKANNDLKWQSIPGEKNGKRQISLSSEEHSSLTYT
jgi:hypothetical protein